MRYFFLSLTAVLFVLMLVVYFQNYSIGATQQVFFLTGEQTTNAANALLYAYLFGILSTVSLLFFLTGGKIDISLPKSGGKGGADDEWK